MLHHRRQWAAESPWVAGMSNGSSTEPVPERTLTAIVVAEGAPALAPEQKAMLDAAVDYLNQVTNEQGLQLAISVSDYVVRTFFGGDLAKLSSRNAHKGASYAALCKRKDLAMGPSTLQRLVRIGLQVKAMPPELGQALTPGHHRALLVVPDPGQKVELAQKTLAEHWTADQLEEVVAKEKPVGGNRPGRKALPEVAKKVAALKRAVEALGSVEEFASSLAELGDAERGALMADLAATSVFIQQLSQG